MDESFEGHVHIAHGAAYSITCVNDNSVRCEVEVFVDGTSIGTWRIDRHSRINIERPVNEAKLLHFYALNTVEAQQAGGSVSEVDNGLVTAVFYPEDAPPPGAFIFPKPPTQSFASQPDWVTSRRPSYKGYTCSYAPPSPAAHFGGPTPTPQFSSPPKQYSAGVTGLSGHSDQKFKTVSSLVRKPNAEVTLHLRLVVDKSAEITPLRARSTPIPPPI